MVISRTLFGDLDAECWLQARHIVHETTQSPDVDLVVEWLLPEHLRADVDWSANFGYLKLASLHRPRNSHVPDFYSVILHHQYVL